MVSKFNLKVSRSPVIWSTKSASVRLIFCPSKFMASSLKELDLYHSAGHPLADPVLYIFVDHIFWICHHLDFQLDRTFEPLGEHFFCVPNEKVSLQQITECTLQSLRKDFLEICYFTFWGCKLRFISAATLQGNIYASVQN